MRDIVDEGDEDFKWVKRYLRPFRTRKGSYFVEGYKKPKRGAGK